jgi:hypothetical protein
MTTMTAGNSEGTYGRCNNKCHAAKNPKCHCLCNGRYHGANYKAGGLKQAMEEFETEVLEGAKARATEEGWTLKANSLADLFGQGSLL